MEQVFRAAYKQLNDKQRLAVDTIDGPVLVIAGPGTGKTQLLSTRVANIIRQTDTAPSNILCLTFTDNAARNMRQRLEAIIGQPAYHVAIHTFHSFGGEVINQYPDFFVNRQLLQQIDELGRYELLRDIFAKLPHSNPLSTKVGEDFVHLKDSLSVISWFKQNALTPSELSNIIVANQKFMDSIEKELAKTFAFTPAAKHLPLYAALLSKVQARLTSQRFSGFPEYAAVCALELQQAIEATDPDGRYAPRITAWRNAWCQKDTAGQHVFKDSGRNLLKLQAVVDVYDQLLTAMTAQGLYDFDDMIIEVVHALEANDDLRYNLQERYQYVLVDEFQDTNKAQLRMLISVGDNPVNEGLPNIMVVGDDDQAIYAFQGAQVSSMVAFAGQYPLAARITLEDNYRSTPRILDASFAVAAQITDRLEATLPDTHKQLIARADLAAGALKHNIFQSELAQYDWIAAQIEQYITQGTVPEAIAVIAPRHRYLERLMPYLLQRRLPVAYERRENILESPIIIQILTMARLITAIASNHHDEIDQFMSHVLSYDFWGIPTTDLIQLSLECYSKHQHWLPTVLGSDKPQLRDIADWFVGLASHSQTEPLEYVLDQLIGGISTGKDNEYDDLQLPKKNINNFISPLRNYYFNSATYEQATDLYLALLGQLSTLRQHLRQWKPGHTLFTADLVVFAELHLTANLKIIDTNPHTQTTNAVQVMTAYKAKGLEFEVVFVINAQDEIWGPTARSRSSSIALPKNLPLAPDSDGDNDKLRLLFVALSRAKHSLYITGYIHTLENKLSPGLSFIGGDTGNVHPDFKAQIIDKPATPQAIEILTTDWAYRFRQVVADKTTLFEPILNIYKLSVTHLNNFIDVKDGGPHYFLLHNLLRFPEAPTPSAAYGDAVHKTLQWAANELRANAKLPTTNKQHDYFEDLLARKHLRTADYKKLLVRGQQALDHYFAERGRKMSPKDMIERGFNNEGVIINGARLSGKIDKLQMGAQGTVSVVDFKTGKPAKSWQGRDEFEKLKLHKYRQQLLFYKLLVENSASYSGKLVAVNGALEFIEPDETGQLTANLEMAFDPAELQEFAKLIGVVWQRIMKLDFPDTSHYPSNLQGVKQFEQDLLNNTI